MKYFKWYIRFFSAILLLILFLPFIFINTAKHSDFEHRDLVKFPKYKTQDGKLNYSFGKDFENFFKDRFFLRRRYIQLYSDLKYYLSIGYYQQENLFFNKKWHYALQKYPVRFPYDVQSDIIVKNLSMLKDFCDKNNIKLYVIICPFKYEIGSLYSYPQAMRYDTSSGIRYLINYIKHHVDVDIIYPYNEIYNLEYYGNEPAYYKIDDHWTHAAAYLVYRQLMDRVKKDYKDIKIYEPEELSPYTSNKVKFNPLHEFSSGRYYNELHLHNEKLLDTKYTYYKPQGNITEKHFFNEKENCNRNIYWNESNKKAPNIFIFGDSFAMGLLPGVISSFHNTFNIFTYPQNDVSYADAANIKKYEKDIIDNKTDILVVTSTGPLRLGYLYTEH